MKARIVEVGKKEMLILRPILNAERLFYFPARPGLDVESKAFARR